MPLKKLIPLISSQKSGLLNVAGDTHPLHPTPTLTVFILDIAINTGNYGKGQTDLAPERGP